MSQTFRTINFGRGEDLTRTLRKLLDPGDLRSDLQEERAAEHRHQHGGRHSGRAIGMFMEGLLTLEGKTAMIQGCLRPPPAGPSWTESRWKRLLGRLPPLGRSRTAGIPNGPLPWVCVCKLQAARGWGGEARTEKLDSHVGSNLS